MTKVVIIVTMRKISNSVEEIIAEDEVALEALRSKLLNLSAYAKSIRGEVERQTSKPVKTGSIVVALSRMGKAVNQIAPLRPRVRICDLAIKAPIFEVTYEKTRENMAKIREIQTKLNAGDNFLTITQGVGEITVICSQKVSEEVKKYVVVKPVGTYDGLGAITVRFNEPDYIEEPNMIYSLVAELAKKRINLIEIVSTFSELSFIVRKTDVDRVVAVLNKLL